MDQFVKTLEQQIRTLQAWKKTVLISIDGCCTAGKTTLAGKLAEIFDCNVFHMDDFFLQPHQRTEKRLAETGGNVDYERFYEEVLLPLKTGNAFSYRPYSCKAGCLTDPLPVTPRDIVIVEGTYCNHPYFQDPYDLKVFLSISPKLQRSRILARPAHLQKRFFDQWIPMETAYFAGFSVCESCDLQFAWE